MKFHDVNPMHSKCRFYSIIESQIRKYCRNPRTILELGCGNGRNLSQFPDSFCVGIDPDSLNVKYAKERVKKGEVYLGNHKILSSFSNNQFDVGFTCSVLDHIENFGPVLANLCRVCKKVILIEPMVKGQPRQALKSETAFWEVTWYHNYPFWLSGLGVDFTISSFPLYKKNSGPLYKKIVVSSANFPKSCNRLLRPLIVASREAVHNSGLHGRFLQVTADMGINSSFYGPKIEGVEGPFAANYSDSISILDVAERVDANLIILYRAHPYKFAKTLPAVNSTVFTKSKIPVVLIDVDFCLLRNQVDFCSELADMHFLRHPLDEKFSRCPIVRFLPFSVNPDIYTYAPFEGRKHICFSGASKKHFYTVRRAAVERTKANSCKGLTPSEQVAFYQQHLVGITDNASPYRYLNAKHFEIPATGTILFTNGKNAVSRYLYPGSFVIYKDDCSDILDLFHDVENNISHWATMAKLGAEHIFAKHSNTARWLEFILTVNAELNTRFDLLRFLFPKIK